MDGLRLDRDELVKELSTILKNRLIARRFTAMLRTEKEVIQCIEEAKRWFS